MLVAAKTAGSISKIKFRNDGTITRITETKAKALLKKITAKPETRGELVISLPAPRSVGGNAKLCF